MMNDMLLFLLVLCLLGAGRQAYALIALVIVFSDRSKLKRRVYLALLTLALFHLSRFMAPPYPEVDIDSKMEGYAYRQTAGCFDFYELSTGRGPILVYYYSPELRREDLEGRRVVLSDVKLVRQQTRNKNGFNIEHYVLSKGYLYALRAKKVAVITGAEGRGTKKDALARRIPSQLRLYVLNKAHLLDKRAGELYRALILGSLPKDSELADLSKASGLIHLFVISGLHFSLLFQLFIRFFKLLFKGRLKLAYSSSLLLSLFYYSVLGGGFGASRAFFSSIFWVHSELKFRKFEALKALALVCLGFLLFLPWSIEQRGFQLSFLATFFIINLSRQGFMIDMESTFLKNLLIALSVNLLLSFFLVLQASQTSALSFVAISYTGFFLSLFLPLLFLFALLPAFMGSLLQPLAALINKLSQLLFDFLALMKTYRLPLRLHPSLAYLLSAFVLLSCVTYLFIYGRGKRKKSLVFLTLSFSLLLGPYLIRPELEFISYDLKDGEANLIKYGNTALLYDVGNDRELVNLLKLDGVNKIDHLIISHADQDHMGIVEDIYREFEVGQAYYDMSSPTKNIGDMELSFDRLEGEYSRNDKSLTMRLKYKTTSIYFTGDIQVDGMKHSLNNYEKCEILKIPHHGSYTDLTPHFIEAYQPDISLISGGRGKRINKEIVHKYLISKGLRFYDTMLHGEVRLRFDRGVWSE